jgi:hypothetical protein
MQPQGPRRMETLQLYAFWALISIGAAGTFLAWWVM